MAGEGNRADLHRDKLGGWGWGGSGRWGTKGGGRASGNCWKCFCLKTASIQGGQPGSPVFGVHLPRSAPLGHREERWSPDFNWPSVKTEWGEGYLHAHSEACRQPAEDCAAYRWAASHHGLLGLPGHPASSRYPPAPKGGPQGPRSPGSLAGATRHEPRHSAEPAVCTANSCKGH